MYRKLAVVLAVTLLSGCTLTDGDKYHQATLDALKQTDSNLNNRITNVQLELSNQTDYIDSLEDKIIKLTDQLTAYQQANLAMMKKLDADNHTSSDANTTSQVKTAAVQPSVPRSELVLGAVEKVTIDDLKKTFDARVDTGAATSSLNAVDIEQFERNGKTWVRFHLADGKQQVDKTWIESPVLRFVKIRQANYSELQRRPVIALWVRVGAIHEKSQFTLADRSQMSHPILLGREFIRDIAVVDVSKNYIQTDNNNTNSTKPTK